MIILSFNSYKGGACRTTTCYNTLPYLAKRLGATSHRPILVFDVDLDSMGLTSLFRGRLEKGAPKRYSAKHLFVEDDCGINNQLRSNGLKSVEENSDFFDLFERVGNALGLEDDGSVLFCGADSNADIISDKQYQTFASNPPLRTLIHALKDMWDDSPVAMIFDCASGVQQTTLTVLSSVDCAVMCMRPTTQFRIGTRDYLLNKIPRRLRNFQAERTRRIVLLPTSVSPINIAENDPNRDEARKTLYALRRETFDKIEEEIVTDIVSEIDRGTSLGYQLDVSMFNQSEDIYGIPEIERFKWTEAELLYKINGNLTEQEKLLRERYRMLADVIAKNTDK